MHVTHGPCVRGLGHPDKLPENNHLHWGVGGEEDPWVDSAAYITWAR